MMKTAMKGQWGFITGNSRISQDVWNRSFPQGIFGRVIEVRKRVLTIRGYGRKGYNSKHPNYNTTRQYFKPLLQNNIQ